MDIQPKKIESRSNQVFISCVDVWNDLNPIHQLDDKLQNITRDHINMAYVTGREDMKRDMINQMNQLLVLHQRVSYQMFINIINKL